MATYISVDDIVYSEGDSQAVFTLRLSGDAATTAIDVNFSTTDGTALDATDFDHVTGIVTIPVGDTSATISVPITDDATLETIEGILLQLSTTTPGAVLTRGTVTGLIVDNDMPAGVPNVSAGDVVVDETDGIATVYITLDKPSDVDVTVHYQTQAATAAPGLLDTEGDYVTDSDSITIPAGQTVASVDVLINNDALAEGREVFALALTGAVNAVITDPRAHVVIQYNDAAAVPTPVVSVQGGTMVENQGYVDFLVTLSAPGSAEARVNYNTGDGTALDGVDYESVTGTLVFAPGETSKTVRVLVADNAVIDGTRTFSLGLSGMSGLVSGVLTAQGVILDNESLTPPTVLAPVLINANAGATGNILGGTGYNDSLTGGAGDDVLDGRALDDTMKGGAGNDTYIAEESGGQITEEAASGNDTIISYLSNYTLSSTIENLVLGGVANISGTGSAEANTLTGNTGNNTLNGAGGNDTIYGGAGNDSLTGGTGTDSLLGGAGDDTYTYDSGDVIVEGLNEGNDTILSAVSLTLAVANVEGITLTGADNVNATGDGLANTLTGNTGNNVMDGGVGADSLAGGQGDDTYVVDNAGDVITEGAGAGTDTVQASITYSLAGLANVENITLTGSAAINATGNALANRVIGNAGANRLVGDAGNDTLGGGAGNDTMVGGLGDDVYYVDAAGDVVTEVAGQGTDTVYSNVSYTLSSEVESLVLTGSAGLSGTGNDSANLLAGNAGANNLTGGLGNDTLNGGAGTDSLAGGQGDDTYVVDNAGDVITEGAGAGTDTVQASITYSLAGLANVENITLTGSAAINATGNALANRVIGNAGANRLVGDAGNDTLGGGAGNDTMVGGLGDDVYYVDAAGDVVTEVAGQGTDTVYSNVSYTLSSEVESLVLTGSAGLSGTGNDSANLLAGNAGANNLTGGLGNDTLNGGAGTDSLAGGQGDDTYVVDNAGDVITEGAGAGTDTVQASITYSLAGLANVENITLTGSAAINATGNALANRVIGNAGANRLVGDAGNDTLGGGAGNDTMVGGLGDDVYYVDAAGDVVTEVAGQGTDTVYSNVSYTLSSEVESLVLTGSAGLSGTGNDSANLLAGNAGANNLTGGLGNDTLNGGAGTDSLAGGQGDDTYVVDNAGDVITEGAGAGTDTVQASITYSLAGLANVENITLTGSAAINATGNALANRVIGNAGANRLVGDAGNDTLGGGAGNDTMVGGLGDDVYYVDAAGDVVTEVAGQGTDTVYSNVSYTLSSEVESLVLTGSAGLSGTGNDSANLLAGNAGANNLTGGLGNDTLNGAAGNDVLNGGVGSDLFVFNGTLNAASNVDTISDFSAGDRIALDNDIFSALGAAGTLNSSSFYAGAGFVESTSAAQAAGVYYDLNTGSLYYDADGFGSGVGVKFAEVSGIPTLSNASFIVQE
ncbi:Na-Ca exchanger/integrin-beta4 [Leptothrix cholodnii SP-6]|uniref:Na-Ca exchanger/integrin-beta4 n=1 Tax=Leptothrix cholodnii (strain ATCC 51168 / LMG 8142 / SP-6) TaxID=395495 RepID=B1XZR1_LEPCP|nr:Calx-beta domain-containing protein [Leptothrix cholodnii]ACB32907.1 Na-Ca exchanger/integrin-beta4 [Leptothrix cholodnii SP-6]